jgi:hypothetical protein
MVRQSGEAYWLMERTRHTVAPPDAATPAAIDELLQRHRVAFLIVDLERYTGSGGEALDAIARARPDRLRLVREFGSARVYEVVATPPPAPSAKSD